MSWGGLIVQEGAFIDTEKSRSVGSSVSTKAIEHGSWLYCDNDKDVSAFLLAYCTSLIFDLL